MGLPVQPLVADRRERRPDLPSTGLDLAVLVDNDVRDLADALTEAEDRKIVAEIDEIRDADGDPPPSPSPRRP